MSELLIPLSGLSSSEIAEKAELDQKYRGKQINEWILKGVSDFDEMTNLPAAIRRKLRQGFTIFSSSVKQELTDDDTSKILIELSDGHLVESVLLTDERGRKTACISSQSGCAMGCSFCRTAAMGLKRNLTPGEIIEQFLHLKRSFGEINNIVFMGMGEPFHNIDAVIRSLRYFTGEEGAGMSPRRITVSTCGITAGIEKLAAEAPAVRLAVSLVTADPVKRSELMPVNRKNDLKSLKKTLLNYQKQGGRRITLECVIIRGINDRKKDAAQIADWAEGLSVIVNVIPWNPVSGMDFAEPKAENIQAFCSALESRRIPVSRRYSRGRGLNAACGQLAAGE